MNWWYRLVRRGRMEDLLERELQFHLDQHAADLVARGHSPAEARRLARLAIGGPEQVKEGCRDARGTRWLEDLGQDIRYALRTLRQRPGFTAVTLATLALGIGAATVMFSVISGVLLKPAQYANPGRLVAIRGYSSDWNVERFGQQNVAYLDFRDCQQAIRSLDLAGRLYDNGTLSEPGEATYVEERGISAGLFSVLGVPLLLGREFLPEDDRPGAVPVAIIGHGLWQRRFAASPAAIGASLVYDARRYTIVGVARPEFRLGDVEADLFTPLGLNTARFLQNRAAHPVGVFGRLHPGATLEQARAELAAVSHNLAAQYPATNGGRILQADTFRIDTGDVGSTLWLLLGAVTLVLLIACVNVASLLTARAVSRERELALRVALGAGRRRLVRQCLTESAVLGLAGGLLGVLLASGGLRPFVAFWPGGLPRAQEISLDWRVLLFAIGISLLSGVLFGLAPALRLPVGHLDAALRSGARSLAGGSRRLHAAFVVSEIALALVLLVAAGMLGRTMLYLAGLDPGLDVRNVLVSRMALSPSTLADNARIRPAWQDVLDRIRRTPGVTAATIVDTVPLRGGNNQNAWWTNASLPPANQMPFALSSSVMPDYLKVTGIPLRQGRFFSDQDRPGQEMVVVIDEMMARHAFPGRDPIGQRLWIPDMGKDPLRVIGVVGHVRYWGLAGDDGAQVRDQFYYSFQQIPDGWLRRWSQLMSIMVRTTPPPLTLVEPLRHELRGSANDQVLYEVRTMEQLAGESIALQRFLLLLFGIFAALALLLACIGIYGVLAYLTGRRVPEIGLRMALGATASDVLRLILRQSLAMIALGAAAGLAAALAAARLLERLVTGMQPTDPVTFAAVVGILAAAALIASFLPARRASKVDPVTALRQE